MTTTWKTVTGVVAGLALVVGATSALGAREQGPAGQRGGFQRGPGMRGPGPGGPMGPMLPGLRQLGLTDAQRDQIRSLMDAHKGEFEAHAQALGPARKALDDAVTAEAFDEATVRQRAADLAAVEAEGAVLRARIHSEVWALLTPDQQQKARDLKAQAEQRRGQMRERMQQRREQRGQRPPRG
ncbi:MAG: Spy/CpxP family protein refolding chaperone [Vicinamibacterales bacterium]